MPGMGKQITTMPVTRRPEKKQHPHVNYYKWQYIQKIMKRMAELKRARTT
jgi:hypothetical protein